MTVKWKTNARGKQTAAVTRELSISIWKYSTAPVERRYNLLLFGLCIMMHFNSDEDARQYAEAWARESLTKGLANLGPEPVTKQKDAI